jgi:glycosyltransferase involved in cell wall biosynthesis
MRIGIDARELHGHPTGVGRHLAGLLGVWATDAAASRHSFVLYLNEAIARSPMPQAELRVVPGAGGTRWEQISLPHAVKQDRLDVFFAPGYTAPLRLKVPFVVLVHDISFVAHAEWFRLKEGLRRRLLTRWSSRRANAVLTVSQTARAEIIASFGLPPDGVRCVYPGITSFQSPSAPSISGTSSEPLVLFVGSIFNRRHIPDLIRGFKPVAHDHLDARLEIVGDNRTYPHQDLPAIVAAEGLQTQVTIRPYMFDDGLAHLYGRARAFAFLSEYEGFGHPPLEALASGVPPLLMDTPVAREVCGDAAIYVRCDDVDAISSALEHLLFDGAMRAKVLKAAPSVLARYSWKRAAAETLELLEAAGG